MVKRVTKKVRGRESRERKRIILIGTEGKNRTETKYFSGFNRYLSQYSIHFSIGNNTDALGVINNTIASMKDIEKDDLVFSFIDYDTLNTKKHYESIAIALKKATKHNITVLVSNPIFEVWFLLHFRYSTRSYGDNEEVIHELRKYIADYEKNSDVFNILYNKISTAIKNAIQLDEYHKQMGHIEIYEKSPSSDVYKLIELLHEDMKKE